MQARTRTTAMLFGTVALVGLWKTPWLVAAVFAGCVGVWWVGRCHHPRPLGLLPPTWDDEGRRRPAQWFCAACGMTWPVEMQRNHAPIQRFTGYDESKAPEAAKRAAALETKRREMAIQRAGLKKVPSPPRRNIVPVRLQRDRPAS